MIEILLRGEEDPILSRKVKDDACSDNQKYKGPILLVSLKNKTI